tara:strand:+ start:138 stop:377 length:240 start_codon:yes stop_codon:yes gene_type:complete
LFFFFQPFQDLCKILKENAMSVKGKAATDKFLDIDLVIQNVMRCWYIWKVPQDGQEGKEDQKEGAAAAVVVEENKKKNE